MIRTSEQASRSYEHPHHENGIGRSEERVMLLLGVLGVFTGYLAGTITGEASAIR